MFAIKYRPQTFEEVKGQTVAKKVLMNISKKPSNAPRVILLSGMTGSGKCVAPDTFIATSEGETQIGSLFEYALMEAETYQICKIKLHDGSYSKYFYNSGIRDMRKILLLSGNYLRATFNHKVLIMGKTHFEWKEMRYLNKGDIVVLHRDYVRNTKKAFDINGLYWGSPIVDIEETIDWALDLNVPITNSYVANGIISHNTTLARIFAKSLNCKSKNKPCLECDSCKRFPSLYYKEYDAAAIDKQAIKNIRDIVYLQSNDYYKVVVFDEAHMLNRPLQNALLKPLEEAHPNVFFLFATTEPEKLLDTIRSRSLELQLESLKKEDIYVLLDNIGANEGLEVPENIKDIIYRRSMGSVRLALQYLNLYAILGEEFEKEIISVRDKLKKMLYKAKLGEIDKDLIIDICSNPLSLIERDFQSLLIEASDKVYLENNNDIVYKTLIKGYMKSNHLLNDSASWYVFLMSIAKNLVKNTNKEV